MIESVTPSEAALLRIFAQVGPAPGTPLTMSVLEYHFCRGGGVFIDQDLYNTIYALQARGFLEPAPETTGNIGWALTTEGCEYIEDAPI